MSEAALVEPVPQARPILLIALAILHLVCYGQMLWATGAWILAGDDMAHGLFAPFVSLYVLYLYRDAILKPASEPSNWSVVLIGLAAALGVVSTLSSSSTFARFAFLLSLSGSALLIGGTVLLKRLSFALGVLLFTFPIPAVLYGEITLPLQLLATRLSEILLEILGFSVYRDGNILQLAHMQLNVVEACSGLRSLVTLSFFCLVYSYFFETSRWTRAVVTLCAIPAAILVNTLRITSTGVLGKFSPEFTKGTWHDLLGWGGFFIGFGLVLLAHHFLGVWRRRRVVGKVAAA